ncbi:hypothetical protein Tco_0033456 [Tanacetum coccineum]
MSTSKTCQQSLTDASSETRPPMLERGSYIPWASRFRRYINRKRENRKWLNKALDKGPYQFEMFIPNNSTVPKLQTAKDLQGDALLHYDAEMELMNLILLSIPNDIYNSVDACTSAKDMGKRVERLIRGTIQNKVDRETCFTNKFDQFVAEPGEALVSVYNRFAQLMNDLERNDMHFPIVTINTKFLNSLQPEWLQYVTQVCLVKPHTGSSSRNTSSYYVTHLTSVVDYEDKYQQDDVHTNSEDPLASAMFGKGHYARTCPKPRVRDSKYFMEQMLLAKQDEAGVILTDKQNDFFFADGSRMEEIEELSANICLMARIQPVDNTSDAGPSYDSAFISEVQSSSNNENEEQMYPTHTKIINSTIGDDQIDSDIIFDSPNRNVNSGSIEKDTHIPDLLLDSDIIFDSPNRNVNSGSIEKDTHIPDLCALEQLARNAYQEAEKQQIFAQKVQKQNMTLTSQLELYKEMVRILENINGDNNDLNEFLEPNKRAKHFSQQAQSQFVHLEVKLKKKVNLISKLGNSLQGMFMLGQKPLSMYDQQLKHGLGYPNPSTLKKAISQCPKLYLASSLGNSEISLHVRDTEDTLDEASKNFVPQKEISAEQQYFPSSFIPSDKNSNATPSISTLMPSESPLIIELDKIKNCFQRLSELIQKNYKRASIFYTSPEEIQLNDFCQDQLKPIINEFQFYFEFFNTLFQRDIKEMKDVFESTESELCEQEKQNDFLKDQLLEVSLKHEVELSVLLNHECVDNSLHAEIEQLKKKSIEIQEGLQARIKILEKDVQRCEQQKIDELIAHVSEKTYAYGAIRAENQNLLISISELKTRLANIEKGINAASSVRRLMNRDSHVKDSVLANSKKPAKKVVVYVRKNKQTDITSETVISNKENVIDIDVANGPKAKTLLCVSCMQNVLIPCLDNCFANYKLNVRSNVRRPLSTKPKIDVGSTSKANDKVSSTKRRNVRDKSLSIYMQNKIQTSRIWQKWFESKPNVVWSPVNINPNGQNSRSSKKQSFSVKKWVVKLPTCPCAISSCIAGSSDCSVDC